MQMYKLLLNGYITVYTEGVSALPTNKAPFNFHLDEITLDKIRYIAKKDTRSVSNLLEHLCKTCVNDYEDKHGEIIIEYE